MKVYFAPDTSDHPNCGCRVMGAWFRAALAGAGVSERLRTGSQWFYRGHADLPDLSTWTDFRRFAGEISAGRILPQIAAVLQDCDLVYLNGENFIRPGTRKGCRLLFLAYLAKAVFNKPCILTNHSVDFSEPELAEIACEVYPLLDEVHFREEASAAEGSRYAAAGHWRLIPDVAWAIPAAPLSEWGDLAFRPGQFCAWPDSAEGFDPRHPYVTVCGSSIIAKAQKENIDVVPAFIDLCRRLQKEVAPVVLAAPDEPDQKVMREVQSALNLPLLGLHLPVRQAIDVIGNATVHVGGRWHLGIFAATGGTPMVALNANSHKVHSLMRQLQMDGPVFDVLRLADHIDDIVRLARAHVDAGPALRANILQRSRALAAQVDQNMEYVRRQAAARGTAVQ
jgi:polysaccharide pyruvyl transferase WcaK-like protein